MSSYPSTSTLAPSYGNFAAFSRVDVESLLWEMSHVVRGLTKVTRAQSAELARLGSGAQGVLDQVAEVLSERASAALRAVDTTLDQLAADVLAQEDDSWYAVDRQGVASWAHATSAELLPADEPATPSDVPADFWNTHEFKWDEEPEPEELERGTSSLVSEILALDTASQFEDDDLVVPSDSITSRGGGDDVDYVDEDEEWDGYSEASFEAGEREHFADRPLVYAERIHAEDADAATLFLAPVDAAPSPSTPSTDADSAMRALRRHSWLGAPQPATKPTASGFDGAAALFGKLLQHSRLAGF